jgi:hypothetical protein
MASLPFKLWTKFDIGGKYPNKSTFIGSLMLFSVATLFIFRPGSIETMRQEESLIMFEKILLTEETEITTNMDK